MDLCFCMGLGHVSSAGYIMICVGYSSSAILCSGQVVRIETVSIDKYSIRVTKEFLWHRANLSKT